MPRKPKTDRVLKGLSGWQAGLLVFEHQWLESRNLPGFLSDSDISTLQAGLKSQQDIQDFNTLIRLFKTVDHLEKQAIAGIYQASRCMERIFGIGNLYMATMMARMQLSSLPLIVTQKELEDLKTEQRETLLQRHYCLDQVVSWRAYEEASEEVKAELDCLPESIEVDAPDLHKKAEQEIRDLVDQGLLPKPKKLNILANSEEVRNDTRTDIAFWSDNQDWTPEQARHYLQHYFSGADLYQAGLAEWKRYIGTFETYLLDKKYWPGEDPPDKVAIVQEASGSGIDSRGHFDKAFLSRWPLTSFHDKDDLQATVTAESEAARTVLERVKLRRQVLEEVSQVIGLAVHDWIDFTIDVILEPSQGRYALFTTEPETRRKHQAVRRTFEETGQEEQMEKVAEEAWDLAATRSLGAILALYDLDLHLAPLSLEKLKIPAKALKEVRSWLNDSLGEDWWKQANPDRPQRSLLPEQAKSMWKRLNTKGQTGGQDA